MINQTIIFREICGKVPEVKFDMGIMQGVRVYFLYGYSLGLLESVKELKKENIPFFTLRGNKFEREWKEFLQVI